MQEKDTSDLSEAALEMSHGDRREAEDILRWLLESEFQKKNADINVLAEIGGVSEGDVRKGLEVALEKGLAAEHEGHYHLLEKGREIAVRIMRAHRLIETMLARDSGTPMEKWHGLAHEREHSLSSEEVNRLADELGNPRFDPHGDPIPTREGDWPPKEGVPLKEWPLKAWGVVDHVEDEPEELFARVVEKGIFSGMRFQVLEAGAEEGLCLRIEGREELLPEGTVNLIRARPLEEGEQAVPDSAIRLSGIQRGESGVILRLLPGCRGAERTRLLDLGFVPGSKIEHVLDSPLRGPAAYRVRGTLIALRKEQAEQVLVSREVAG